MNTRRQFLITAAMGTVNVAACQPQQQATSSSAAPPATPGAPSAFGTAPSAGPEVSPSTFAEAEKLVQVTMTDGERQVAAGNWRNAMAPLYERRVGPRKVAIPSSPRPLLLGSSPPRYHLWASGQSFIRSPDARIPRRDDADIAFAPVTPLSRWIEANAQLRAPHAHLPQAHRAVRSEAADRHHAHPGRRARRRRSRPTPRSRPASTAARSTASPTGCKDLLDTAGIPTTYGAEPFRNRVPTPTPSSSSASTTPAPCSSRSSRSAPSLSTTSGSAARP